MPGEEEPFFLLSRSSYLVYLLLVVVAVKSIGQENENTHTPGLASSLFYCRPFAPREKLAVVVVVVVVVVVRTPNRIASHRIGSARNIDEAAPESSLNSLGLLFRYFLVCERN